MRRRTAALAALVVMTGALSVGGVGHADPDGCNGRELHRKGTGSGGSDIVNGDTDWVAAGDGYDITVHLVLAGTSCTEVTYGAAIWTAAGGTFIDAGTENGDGLNDVVSVQLHATTAQATTSSGALCVGVTATTSYRSDLDTAPDAGTVVFCTPDSGGLNFR